ncbi:M3 family oligoendopeptidase [Marinigracilibium pacificum]|uniref:M3 family oligoendopeptidase n=1 Tax=Marinigracilibium pacificum TaxID=2729599 RepID=A0A848J4V1_9BACT|nr:M3 family oligoendopeptidase [Marinigracilibium pacificum]NMM49379.1 M3 family oligoendopeptidase [Marinigracilibium pacificum]
MINTTDTPDTPKREFLPQLLKVNSWEDIKPFFDNLLDRKLSTEEELRKWFKDRSELEAVVSEDLGWRYIRMTTDTANEKFVDDYRNFVQNIQPHIAPYSDKLNKKAIENEFLEGVEKEKAYHILTRAMRESIKIFREENIPLQTEAQTKSQEYGTVTGAMTIELDGKELTLQQAGDFLLSPDRELREDVYRKIADRRLEDKAKLDSIFSDLVSLRNQMGQNSGFDNYRDYMFSAMGRFDYTVEDCYAFHESVAQEVVPLLNDMAERRKQSLGVDSLRPWDKSVDPEGKKPLKPFEGGEELLEKTIQVFNRLDTYLGDCLIKMREMGHLDLESRKGKAPGGYNYPLSETGVPFIFMNATTKLRDMVTLLHEGGHAVHSFLANDLELTDFKHTPSEVAELASMSMELITMDHWDIFFSDEEELKRAKKEHLEQIIQTLPWVATIDKFQHWIYENPNHTVEERDAEWVKIFSQFADSLTDWSGLEHYRENLWQRQLHLYEVPFYYIEYGMAQLGAVAVWKRFKEDNKAGLEGYKNALKLGYTKTIPEIYEAAGISFDFSSDYIKELMSFVNDELNKIV